MSRPIRQYAVSFRHFSGVSFETEVEGETPCAAKNEAWCQLEDAKRGSPHTYPNDNEWNIVSFTLVQVG